MEHQNILKFDLARNCLRYLVQKFKIKRMFLPYYLCDVIRHTLFEEGCKPLFYHINNDFMPEIQFPKEEYILYPNYFGIFRKNVEKMAATYPKLIVDNAHAFYDEPIGFACFNSGYKFGYGKNAYLWIGKNDDSNEFSKYINPVQKQKCRNRFIELHKTYSGINEIKFDMNMEVIPFCYPLLTSSEDISNSIVKELNQKGVIIYRYWNLLPKSFNEYKYYSRLVPIPTVEYYPLKAQ